MGPKNKGGVLCQQLSASLCVKMRHSMLRHLCQIPRGDLADLYLLGRYSLMASTYHKCPGLVRDGGMCCLGPQPVCRLCNYLAT